MRERKIVMLQDLAKAYNSPDHNEYKKVLRKADVSKELFSTLIRPKNEWRFAKNVEIQQEEIEIIEKIILQFEEQLSLTEIDYNKAVDKYNHAKKLYDSARRIQERQRQKMDEAKELMGRATKAKIHSNNEIKTMNIILQSNQKRLENMKMFALVHPTATLSAIDKKCQTVLVCTKFDAVKMNFESFADKIEDTAEDDLELPCGAREKFETDVEFKSAIEYVKLVVRYWAEDKPYTLLYNSEGIKYLLEETFK